MKSGTLSVYVHQIKACTVDLTCSPLLFSLFFGIDENARLRLGRTVAKLFRRT